MTQFNFQVEVDPSGVIRGTGQIRREFQRTEGTANRLRNTVRNTFALLGGGALAGRGLRGLRDYGQQMAAVNAITNATRLQFAGLTEESLRLGRTTRFTSKEAADGLLFLARAGLGAEKSMAALEDTLKLAQAGAVSVGRAADIATNILTGFRKEVDELGAANDILAFTINNSNTNLLQLGEAMKFVAPVAAGLNVSLETTNAALAILANAGLQASIGGTGLRRVLSELESPSRKTERIISQLGLTTEEVSSSQNDLVTVLGKLEAAGITTGQALEFFGDRGGPAFEALVSNLPALIAFEESLQDADGTVTRLAEVMDQTLDSAFKKVTSAAQGFVFELAGLGAETTLTEGLLSIAETINVATDNLERFETEVETAGIVLISYFTGRTLSAVLFGLRTLAVSAGIAGAAVGGITAAITGVGLLAAFATGLYLIRDAADDSARSLADLERVALNNVKSLGTLEIEGLRAEISARETVIAQSEARVSQLQAQVDAVKEVDLRSLSGASGAGVDAIIGEQKLRQSRIDGIRTLKEGIIIRRQEVEILSEEVEAREKQIALAEKLEGIQENIRKRAEAAAAVQENLDVTDAISALAADGLSLLNETNRQREVSNELLRIQKELQIDEINPAQLEALRTQLELNQILQDVADVREDILGPVQELLRLEQALNVAEDAGLDVTRQRRDMLMEIAQLNAEQATTFGQGLTAELQLQVFRIQDAFVKLGQSIGQIFGPDGTLVQGISDATARAIVFGDSFSGALKRIGQQIAVEILSQLIKIGIQFAINAATGQALAAAATATTVAQAAVVAGAWSTPAALASLATLGANAGPAATALAGITALSKALAVSGAAIPGLAFGGVVPGSGGPRSDDVLARLSSGEFVVNAFSSKQFRPLLEAVNNNPGGVSRALAAGTGGGGLTVSIPNITIHANDAQGGREAAEEFRAMVVEEIQNQTRVGGALEGAV